MIFGEGGNHGHFFIINQCGGFVGGFTKLGGVEESLRIGEQEVVAIELLVLGEGHGVVLGHEVFGEFELCFEYPIGGINQVNFTGECGVGCLSAIHANSQYSAILGVLVSAEEFEAIGEQGGVG